MQVTGGSTLLKFEPSVTMLGRTFNYFFHSGSHFRFLSIQVDYCFNFSTLAPLKLGLISTLP